MAAMRLTLVPLLLVASIASAADAPWHRAGEDDGIVLETRAIEGSALHEVRATAHSPLPPTAILATLWNHEELVGFVPYLKRLDVLQDDGDVRLLYEQIRVPVLRNRDVTLRATRHVDPETGICEVTAVTVPDAGPPPVRDHVRMRASFSYWRLEPATDGGTDVSYTVRTDAGGFVPAWIVNAAQIETTPKLVRAMLDRAAARRR